VPAAGEVVELMTSTSAAVLREKGGPFRIEAVSLADPRPDEVQIRLVAAGVCHTDILVRDQILPPPLPVVLGHEGSGIVEQVGAAVSNLTPGDHVVLAPRHCAGCRTCLTGHPMNCESWGPLNLRGRRSDGSTAFRDRAGAEVNAHFFGQSSFAAHTVVSAGSAIRVPSEVPLELLGPFGCGLQAGAGTVLNALRPSAGSSIAVFGVGAVGLAATIAAELVGCAPIIAVDLRPDRLELARDLGATHSVDSRADTADVVRAVLAVSGRGVDFSVDAVGVPATARAAVAVLAAGGAAAIAGSGAAGRDVAFDLNQLMGRSVRGVLEGDSVPAMFIPYLVELYRSGRFPVDRLMRRYPFEDINEAIRDAVSGATVKPVLMY
jgi:aryl-alcohol dehydrogenase